MRITMVYSKVVRVPMDRGVGFLINKNISAYIIDVLTRTNEEIECIFIHVLDDKESFILGSIYRIQISISKCVFVWRYEH